MARYLEEPDVADIQFDEVLRAISDDARMRILVTLADGEYHTCGPEDLLSDLHKSTLSHHKKVLREAGVTRTQLVGRNFLVRLRREDLDARFPGFLDTVLAGLEGLLTTAPAMAPAGRAANDV
jgi:DNA-binding transcriptional ArsR family regulator